MSAALPKVNLLQVRATRAGLQMDIPTLFRRALGDSAKFSAGKVGCQFAVAREPIQIYFTSRQSVVAPAEAAKLRAALEPYRNKHVLFSLVGAADVRGPTRENEALSRARAESVSRWLMAEYDVPPARISVAALGGTSKFSMDLAENRRVTLYVLGAEATVGGGPASPVVRPF